LAIEHKDTRAWVVTGDPGIGKSTLMRRVVNEVKTGGYLVGGFTTQDIRSHGSRTGFEIYDLSTGRRGVLASTTLRVGPKIGRYKVNLVDLSGIATKSILESLSIADLIVYDELGPMELLSPEFRRAVKTMIDSDRPIFCSIHKKLADPLITDLRNILSSELYLVDLSNRELLVPQISRSIIQSLGRK